MEQVYTLSSSSHGKGRHGRSQRFCGALTGWEDEMLGTFAQESADCNFQSDVPMHAAQTPFLCMCN